MDCYINDLDSWSQLLLRVHQLNDQQSTHSYIHAVDERYQAGGKVEWIKVKIPRLEFFGEDLDDASYSSVKLSAAKVVDLFYDYATAASSCSDRSWEALRLLKSRIRTHYYAGALGKMALTMGWRDFEKTPIALKLAQIEQTLIAKGHQK